MNSADAVPCKTFCDSSRKHAFCLSQCATFKRFLKTTHQAYPFIQALNNCHVSCPANDVECTITCIRLQAFVQRLSKMVDPIGAHAGVKVPKIDKP